MKNLLNTKYAPAGMMAALLAGIIWVTLLRRFGHVSLNVIGPWIVPLAVILAIIGLSVGLIGKRNDNQPGKVFFSTLFSAGLGAFSMLPLTAIVALPLGKLAERLGLINRAAIYPARLLQR